MSSRDKNISYEHLTHPFPGWPAGGCDQESIDSEFPPDCVRKLTNYDFYGPWKCAQRHGTRLIERFVKRIPLADGTGDESRVEDIRHFRTAEGDLERTYFAAGKRLYAKIGAFAGFPIKEDLNDGSRVRSMIARNLTWYCDGSGYPFVVCHDKFPGGKYWRETGFDPPDITRMRATPRAGGNLVQGKAYQYRVYLAIADKYVYSISPWGETASGLSYTRGELTASRKAILLENLPVPDVASPINYMLIYRTAELDKDIFDGTYYFWRAISDKDAAWKNGKILDDGSIPVDLANTSLSGNTRPPKGASFALDNTLGQMFYFKGCDAYYSKTGEPESVPYVMSVDRSSGGSIVAASVLEDGNLLIWKERAMYIAGRFTSDAELYDYRPMNLGIGCAGPKLQCTTKYGPAWMGDDREVYVWAGGGAKPLLNKHDKSFRRVFARATESSLKRGCMAYDKHADRLYIGFLDPTISKTLWNSTTSAWEEYACSENNCVCYYDFTYKRWVWPWTIEASCMEVVEGRETGPRIWIGSSTDGCVYEMNYGNVDKYCPGLPGVYAPWINAALSVSTMTAADIRIVRGDDEGDWVFEFGTNGTVMGTVHDSQNEYADGEEAWAQGPLRVTVRRVNADAITLKRRDRVKIIIQQGVRVDVYFPEYSGAGPLALYVGSDGSTYYDAALTQVACYNPRYGHSGTWLPDQPENLFAWDAREGDQIYSEIESGHVELNLGHTPYGNSDWVMKQLGWCYMQVSPMPEDEFIIEVYSHDGVLLDSFRPVFTKAGGWDYENWDVMTYDAQVVESISRPWSGLCQAQSFFYKIKYPVTKGILVGGSMGIRSINQEFWNLFGQVATATVDVRE
jgi:hypothetical protein